MAPKRASRLAFASPQANNIVLDTASLKVFEIQFRGSHLAFQRVDLCVKHGLSLGDLPMVFIVDQHEPIGEFLDDSSYVKATI